MVMGPDLGLCGFIWMVAFYDTQKVLRSYGSLAPYKGTEVLW